MLDTLDRKKILFYFKFVLKLKGIVCKPII